MSDRWDNSIKFHIQVQLYDDGHEKFRTKSMEEVIEWLRTCCCRKRFWNDDWEERACVIFREISLAGQLETSGDENSDIIYYKLGPAGVQDMYKD